MASSAWQASALSLTLLGFLFLLITTVSNEWKTSKMRIAVITENWCYEGLWMNCAENALGSVQCKKFYSLLSVDKLSYCIKLILTLPISQENYPDINNDLNRPLFISLTTSHIQACRALMIISLILGMCGTLLTLFGLRCTQLGNSDAATKTKMAMTGGMIFILAGLSSMVAISWYAARITTEFFDSLYGGTKYELGYALYLGWAGSVLSILGGIFLTCSCKEKHRDYKYAAGQRMNEPRIYIKRTETVTPVKDYV